MELNETILIKTEVQTCACAGCFYNRPDEITPEKGCTRPAAAAMRDECFEPEQGGKFFIFKPQNEK